MGRQPNSGADPHTHTHSLTELALPFQNIRRVVDTGNTCQKLANQLTWILTKFIFSTALLYYLQLQLTMAIT
jgi:hypothetical protein